MRTRPASVGNCTAPMAKCGASNLKPRVSGFDFPMLRSLAEQGVGITLLPETLCAQQVRDGTLEVVLPQWRLPQGIFHAVFASRRGLLPAVRVFIDFLAEKMPPLLDAARLDCGNAAKAALRSDRRTPRRMEASPTIHPLIPMQPVDAEFPSSSMRGQVPKVATMHGARSTPRSPNTGCAPASS